MSIYYAHYKPKFLVLLVYFCVLISVLIQFSFLFDVRVNFKVIGAIWGIMELNGKNGA